MSVSSLALDPSWRDYFGMWNPLVEPQIAPLELSACHAPRFVLIPDQLSQVVPSTGKIEYNFFLVPGSIIWGLYPAYSDQVLQLTDISAEHKFFQEPIKSVLLGTPGTPANFPGFTLLPAPHPVCGDGLFTLEVWGDPDSTFLMFLGVAEVTSCPVR